MLLVDQVVLINKEKQGEEEFVAQEKGDGMKVLCSWQEQLNSRFTTDTSQSAATTINAILKSSTPIDSTTQKNYSGINDDTADGAEQVVNDKYSPVKSCYSILVIARIAKKYFVSRLLLGGQR